VWWLYVIVVAVLLFGIYAFLTLAGFETRVLSRRTTRKAESMYPSYGDSPRKQRRYAEQHGGNRQTRAPTLAGPKTRSQSGSGYGRDGCPSAEGARRRSGRGQGKYGGPRDRLASMGECLGEAYPGAGLASARVRKSLTTWMYGPRSSTNAMCELFSKITSSAPRIPLASTAR
jgi:hypothetical protein